MIIYYLIHNTIRTVLLYLNQSAHIVDQICESDVKCRPNYPDSSEKQSLHALFHETIDMFDAACCIDGAYARVENTHIGTPNLRNDKANLGLTGSDLSWLFL